VSADNHSITSRMVWFCRAVFAIALVSFLAVVAAVIDALIARETP
jgi:hypothetical protein